MPQRLGIRAGVYPLTASDDGAYAPQWRMLRSQKGHPVFVWEGTPVPRVPDDTLDCVIYLYPSVDAAERGERAGGTGFLVAIPSEVRSDKGYIYAVTNSHVIREGQSPVIKINTRCGEADVIPLEERHWVHHSDGDDLAVCAIKLSNDLHTIVVVTKQRFITNEIIKKHNIGIGDEVYISGRFISHEGKQRNTPAVRFGTIAMMPHEGVRTPRGLLQESFLVEVHSISGFSGSPVFVFIPPFTSRPGLKGWSTGQGPWLLGVDWGHLPYYEKVRDPANDLRPINEGWVVQSNAGLMGVVPAWKLDELLNLEQFVAQRRLFDRMMAAENKSEFVFDVAADEAKSPRDSNPKHKEDFDNLLRAAAKASEAAATKKKSRDQT